MILWLIPSRSFYAGAAEGYSYGGTTNTGFKGTMVWNGSESKEIIGADESSVTSADFPAVQMSSAPALVNCNAASTGGEEDSPCRDS